MDRLAPMIIPALLLVVLCYPGCGRANFAPFHDLGSAERIPAEKHPASHGPQIDAGDFHGDPYGAYPGLGFGPMGPVIRSALPNDDTLRSLSSASNDDAGQRNIPKESQLASARSGDDIAVGDSSSGNEHSPKPEYRIVSVEFTRVETPFLIGIWIFFASIAKIGFHMTPKLNKIFPESCLLIAVGVIVGLLLFQASSVHISPLTPDTFFLYMLPPIILDAGYFMPNRLFFDHLGTILLFAVVGTVLNTMSIGVSLWLLGKSGMFGCETPILDMFLFSALISAVDPVAVLAVFEEIHVNEILYIVVFGESLLNDAVTVVLYHMFETYSEMGPSRIIYTDVLSGLASFLVVAIGGTVIGVVWGFATGFVTRFTHQVRVIEPIFIFVMAYLAYLSAEIFHLSGILAITFCGITMKNYVEANISHKSHTTVKYTMKMLSSSSETIIFMFLGVATVNNAHNWNTWFVVMTIVFCSIYRAMGVIVLTALANQFRLHKLDKVEKFVMSYGGLRGAVAFALVLLIDPRHVPLQPMFVTTTIAVIYFTVFIQGITIKPLVKILNVKRAEKRKPTMNERIHERIMDHTMAGIEDILGKHGNYHVRDKFKRFDNKFIRPYLVKDHCGAEPKILETYSKLAMKDALDYIRRNASTIGNISGTESMSAIFRNYSNTGQFNGSPSCSQLETGWNIDLQELEYNPSKKDLTDARIHHLLAEELCKPYKRHRRLSYSRHAVNDRDLSTQVNYKMHMNIRRMMGEHKHRHKRSKKLLKDGKQNHVSFPEFQQQNGSTKLFTQDYINGVLYELENGETSKPSSKEDWDSAITFTARTSDSPNVNADNQHATTATTSMDTINTDEGDLKIGRDGAEGYRVTTPTATETMLPWKREDDYESGHPIKQHEFPAWCSNKEYLAYSSPSATFLGGIEQPKVQSVIGLFRRESVCTPDSIDCQETVDEVDETDEYTPAEMDSPAKTKGNPRRVPARRVSMMELGFADRARSVDKTADDGSHSLPDCWNVQRVRLNSLACSPAQMPTLSTALITSSTSESSEDVDDEEEEKA
ncbi:PREDICTED: sodium/hydrogen exchanger 3 isoform X1 [Atta colombica]|uniref:sodium/hydrogen exchanger 3 isoform X1 n=1 Tax=Atta colombica TaxID=520822 RepID=UPI00084BC64D|nr:PREDICTED: sodium/hydrogen exchanger 3 isoform X1 [Atta colombica]XP_018053410.1 PREDICTED: sodium/hydrogen exchanger 3 isoform X1 [Atta colombica]XP_018053411.1 PREDICTED: sodium/hydrogen exchanger 3 isoform X1 [Atta colombica]